MTKEKTQTDITDLVHQTQNLFKLNGAAQPQFEQFWKMQDAMLKEAEAFTRHWFERRHEASESAVEALHEMNSAASAEPAAAMRAIADWQRGSLERVNADLQEWIALCTHVSQLAATPESEDAPSDTVKDKTTKAKRGAASGSRSEHATPV